MRSVVMMLVLLTSTIAVAQPDKIKAEAAARDGEQRYQAGDYGLAAERFQLAYELDPNPAYLFNLAQSYRLGNACAKSADAYRRLLAVVSSGPNVAKVQGYIEQMDACAKNQTPPPTPEPTPPVTTPTVTPRQPPPPPVVKRGGNPTLRYAGIGVGALGLVGLVVGGVFAKKTADSTSAREDLCAHGCRWADVEARAADLDAEGNRHERRMQIGFIGGGIALAAGVSMVLLSLDRSGENQAMIVPTEGGAVAVGSFRF